MVPEQPREKLHETPFQWKKTWVWWHRPVTPGTSGSIKQEDFSPGWPGEKAIPYLQNNRV
jgi:hypothetical protein